MKKWLLLACSGLNLPLFAQVNQQENRLERDRLIEQKIEQIAEASENDELDYNTLFEQLSVYLDFPLNLNIATAEELHGMGILSSYQIDQFLEYRETYGELFSLYELPMINGWDIASTESILPFVRLQGNPEKDTITLEKLRKDGKNEVIVRWQRILEEQEGFSPVDKQTLTDNPNARYLGSPDKLYARYRYRYSNRVSFGFTAEKDAGEEFFQGSQPQGFDFYSAHLYLKDFGKLKAFAVGDYQAQFGQGLTFWSGLGFNRKSAFTLSTAQTAPGISTYTSINENLFLRGIAATVELWKLDFSVFYSGKSVDGNLVGNSQSDSLDAVDDVTSISAFQQTGFHRTPSEVEDKNAIFQRHFGANLSYHQSHLSVGITAVHMETEGNLNREFVPYSQFRFGGNANSIIGTDYQYQFRNFFLYGETSRSQNGAVATVNGLNVDLDPRLSLNVLQRYYATNFQAVSSTAFGEGSSVENEAGVYLGLELRPFKRFKVNAFFDQFRFPWLRYLVDAPSEGKDFFLQAEYQASSRTNVYLRYRHRNKQINSSEGVAGINPLVDNPRSSYRVNFSHKVSNQIRLRSRIELSQYQRGEAAVENGYLVYQDVIYTPFQLPLSLSLRYALYDTDSYNARFYAYENDVLYAWSIPGYFGRGSRTYALLKYRVGRNLDLWLRYGQFYYTDRNVVGTSRDEIAGRTKSEVKFQIRYDF